MAKRNNKYGRPRNGSGRGGLSVVKVYRMRKRGWGARRIARKFNVTRQAVYQFMRRHGMELSDVRPS